MNIIIIAHYLRKNYANKLSKLLDGYIILDTQGYGAMNGHKKALEYINNKDNISIIMEDDAIPVKDFKSKALKWINRFPDNLISFYLGTGRPPQYQSIIKNLIKETNKDYIILDTLIHGVCYYLPKYYIKPILERINNNKQIDFFIGDTYRKLSNKPIIYPILSLVDHRDKDSIEKHIDAMPRVESRKAYYLDK